MISGDERREVAANLRRIDDETCALIDERIHRLTNEMLARNAVLNIGACMAMYAAGLETKTLGDFWDLLADLIDPTTTVDETGVETVADAVHLCECNECGHSFEWVYGEYEYCPRCGSRIVGGNEHEKASDSMPLEGGGAE